MRHRGKIEATIGLARVTLDLAQTGGIARHLWGFVNGKPVDGQRQSTREVPPETAVSQAISKDLKARGARFVGPTIVYAFMQAVGMANDHLVSCRRHAACRALAESRPW